MKMNKAILGFVLASVLLLGLAMVSAQGLQDGTGVYHDEIVAAGGQNGTPVVGEGLQVQAGETYMAQNGEQVQVQQGEGNRLRLKVRDAEAHTDLEVTSEGQKLRAKLSNGRNAEIKIMPDTASERALQRLRIKNCSGNCTIELKQVGEGEQARLAYEVQTERHSRVLGLFKAKMQVQAQVDAETGELIRVGKPWWAFLAVEPEE